jgi:eukaryotic-like serine/threonine-protein kinase
LVGRLIGDRYLVGARIARGGSATVYRARDHRLERDVALKIIRPEMGRDPEFREHFAREARTSAHLSHPHVVQVFDQDYDGDLCYLAMELLEGGTLRDYLSESGALAPRAALDVLEPVLAALSAAHGAGLVHEDVKPENVIITEEGRIKVADFGLARATSSCEAAPEPSIRTAAYLAPEILTGAPADARSDVHAVGIMLFEMLTGALPYTGNTYTEAARRHVEQDVPRPSDLVPGLTETLDGLVSRAAARNPEDRPTDATALARSLGSVRAHLPDTVLDLRAPRAPARTTASPRPGRHRAALATGAPQPGAVAGATASPVPGPPSTLPTPIPTDPEAQAVGQGAPAPGQVGDPGATHLMGGQSFGNTPQMVPGPDQAPPYGTPGPPYGETGDPYGPPGHPYDVPGGPYGQDPRFQGGPGGPYADRRSSPHPPAGPGWYPPAPGPDQPFGGSPPTGRATTLQRMINLRDRKGTIGVAVLVGLSLLLAGWAWWVAAGPGAYRTTPNVVGLTQQQAVERLGAEGLSTRAENAYSDTAPTGTVLRTNPQADGKVRERGRVTLFVCAGPQTVTVPSVQGRTVDEVTESLRKAHLVPGEHSEQYHDTVPEGSVVSSDPIAGRKVDNGTRVNLVLSQGPQPVTVPNVVGSTEEQAVQALTGKGLSGRVGERRQDPALPLGQVISQTPSAGQSAGRGGTVILVVSAGPAQVGVPDVTGKKAKEAKKLLEQAGFKVEIDRMMGAPMGVVRSQTPAAGQQAAPGTTVALRVF